MDETTTKGKRGGVRLPVNEVTLVPKVAAELALGKAPTEIARILGVGYNTVRKIAGKEETRAIVQEIAMSYKDVAKAYCMKAVTEMNELAVEGLKKALRDGNVQAVRTHFQVIGLLGEAEDANKDKGSQSLTVVLPGATIEQPKVIEVESGEVGIQPGDEGSNDL